ncbi:YqjD family protein [Phaeobacter sp. 22II1-1F12B]|uniref:DUF883 family protein n=1 Tax=Phaeobacter sp. 22II1-1F12B TaxID=1317111 RepID=UPI000B525117|nr:DUF883 family protein [Phaeobacter sp. 22II1-1F12B]
MANTTTKLNPASDSTQQKTVDELSAQIETLRKDLSSLTETITELGREKKSELTDTARRKKAEAEEYISTQARDARDQATEFVSTQPATALGIAAGIGFLIGCLTSRR